MKKKKNATQHQSQFGRHVKGGWLMSLIIWHLRNGKYSNNNSNDNEGILTKTEKDK